MCIATRRLIKYNVIYYKPLFEFVFNQECVSLLIFKGRTEKGVINVI